MCGRYTQTCSGEAIAAIFHLSNTPEPTPRYNIAPTQPVSAIASAIGQSGIGQSGIERQYRIFQWGLIPAWAKDPTIGNRMINARAETAAEKPSFRTAFKRRRCLIVADGFYEWKQPVADTLAKKTAKGKKQPYYIQMRDQSLFAMAGLWERWESGDGSYIESCTILTTEPNGLMQSIHNRMPVILHSEDYDLWLDHKEQTRDRLQPLLRPYEDDAMQAYPVSTTVNSPQNETAACVEPLSA